MEIKILKNMSILTHAYTRARACTHTHTHTHTHTFDHATSTWCTLGNANVDGIVIFKPHNLRFI